MLAETFHALADSGNEVLLLVAQRRSERRPADQEHPLGHGREAYFLGADRLHAHSRCSSRAAAAAALGAPGHPKRKKRGGGGGGGGGDHSSNAGGLFFRRVRGAPRGLGAREPVAPARLPPAEQGGRRAPAAGSSSSTSISAPIPSRACAFCGGRRRRRGQRHRGDGGIALHQIHGILDPRRRRRESSSGRSSGMSRWSWRGATATSSSVEGAPKNIHLRVQELILARGGRPCRDRAAGHVSGTAPALGDRAHRHRRRAQWRQRQGSREGAGRDADPGFPASISRVDLVPESHRASA